VSAAFLHLTLRGHPGRVLVQEEGDWRELGAVAERMLFWCGGAIHGCRCEGDELHFAIELAQAPLAQVVRHLSNGYAGYLRRRHGWAGGIFRRYRAVPVDVALYWDDLVVWLHQPRRCNGRTTTCWTADAAYRQPGALPWISTGLVLESLGGTGVIEYRRCLMQPIAPQVVELLTRSSRGADRGAASPSGLNAVDLERIVGRVAAASGHSYEDMCSASRRRSLTRAKAVATVLSVRCGASAATMARLFRRSRSTLSEQVEHYRQTQPHIYLEAERAFAMDNATSRTGDRGVSKLGLGT
jgi:hypothetical protein